MPNSVVGLWRHDPQYREGKFPLLFRRDGSQPEWPYFVLGARDPAAPFALRMYAEMARERGMAIAYCESVRQEAGRFNDFRLLHGNGDPDKGPHRKDNPLILALARGEVEFALLEKLYYEHIAKPGA